jgi:hypothetical protein
MSWNAADEHMVQAKAQLLLLGGRPRFFWRKIQKMEAVPGM